MALPYFAILLFTIFSSLYFIYSGDRISPTDNRRGQIAGLMETCHEAAVAETVTNTALGAGAATVLACNSTSLTGPRAASLNVPSLQIVIEPSSILFPGTTGRTITTYLPVNNPLGFTPFAEVVTEVTTLYSNNISVGLVTTIGGVHRLSNSSNVVIYVPAQAVDGSLAMVTSIK